MDRFRDDDRGYLGWITAHGHGYIINIRRSLNPAEARVHRADCYTISGQRTGSRPHRTTPTAMNRAATP